jgi:hypothetical protein
MIEKVAIDWITDASVCKNVRDLLAKVNEIIDHLNTQEEKAKQL